MDCKGLMAYDKKKLYVNNNGYQKIHSAGSVVSSIYGSSWSSFIFIISMKILMNSLVSLI